MIACQGEEHLVKKSVPQGFFLIHAGHKPIRHIHKLEISTTDLRPLRERLQQFLCGPSDDYEDENEDEWVHEYEHGSPSLSGQLFQGCH